MTKLRPVDAPQGQDTYRRLVDEIRLGQLRPGDRLTETDLAGRLGISRTPVREAIRRLEADGLVVHLPHVGASVRVLSYAELTELYDMRAVLEATAAQMAARTASAVEIADLEAINAEMHASKAEATALAELNRQFHRTLLNAARNRFLTESVNGLQKTMLCLGPTTLEEAGRAAQAVAEHDQILTALKQHDGAAAAAAMLAHIEGAHRMRLKQFRNEERDLGAP